MRASASGSLEIWGTEAKDFRDKAELPTSTGQLSTFLGSGAEENRQDEGA